MGSAARDALVQMDIFPRASATISAALLSSHGAANAASRGDQRFPAADSGCLMPRCYVRGIVNSRAVCTSWSITHCSERDDAVSSSSSHFSKIVGAINSWFIRHGIIYYWNRAAARQLGLKIVSYSNKHEKTMNGRQCARNLLKTIFFFL